MARGLPDYFNPDTVIASRLIDMGQVLTSLIGIATLDGRGRLMWFDNFRYGLGAWELASGLFGSAPVISTLYSAVPPGCCQHSPCSALGGGYSYMRRYIHFKAGGLVGVEFSLLNRFPNLICYQKITYSANGLYWRSNVKIDGTTGIISIYTNGAFLDVGNIGTDLLGQAWVILKVVVDLDNKTFARLLTNLEEIDLSAYPLDSGVTLNVNLFNLEIRTEAAAAGTDRGHYGHVFITIDEPV